MSNTHELIVCVQGSIGAPPVELGRKGWCRFCGSTDEKRFRNTSHTLPEALGNKWIVSLDECDDCNRLFCRYDDALAKAVGAILTVGGTIGKRNAVRQTGRTGSSAVINHSTVDGQRRISMRVTGAQASDVVAMSEDGARLRFTVPTAPERFIPLDGYRALVKMGLAILPDDELGNFTRLRAWVCGKGQSETLPHHGVGLSFGSVGNAPPLAAAALVKRKPDKPEQPYMVFVLSIGSVCCQIDLKPDAMDGPWPPTRAVSCHIDWTNQICSPESGETVTIRYSRGRQLDWASTELQLPPVESITTEVDLRTQHAVMTPNFRKGL